MLLMINDIHLYSKYHTLQMVNVLSSVKRQGFEPYIKGLSDALQGGIPEGSWVSIYGPPGSYKTLHSLAFCLSAIINGERCIYVTTEMYTHQLKRQISSLGWRLSGHEVEFANYILKNSDFGTYELVWIDLDSLYWWGRRLNSISRKENKQSNVYLFDNPTLLTHIIITALGAVGIVEKDFSKISLNEVMYSRLKDGLSKKPSFFKINQDIKARVIIDSFSTYITGRKYSVAGRILTEMKIRLSLPNVTYLVVNHVPKSNEEELGASIGHVVDGRIKLWNELNKETTEYKGWISKMRETDHSRRVHRIIMDKEETVKLYWEI